MTQPSWIKRTLSGRYLIEALLGQGGMSAVYKASDPNLKRVVAIKLIHSHLATDAKFITRFEEEAAAVAKLRHPNIVQVFDFNSDDGVYYMVLEFIPGETLQERLRRLNKAGRHLSLEEAINFTVNICDALGYAHKQGMVHRDVKPANIMLDVHGQAILMDFGIVKIIGGDSHTATGAVVGTARYLAPETIRSEVPDQRSDLYSLGITLYEMLSGETPFNSDSAMSLMMMHLNDPVPDLRSMRPDVPPALVNILLKALEKEPDRRFSSAAEMSAELKRVLAELERKSAVSEDTQVESAAPTPGQAKTQIETRVEAWDEPPVPPEKAKETAISQEASFAPLVEPKMTGAPATQADTGADNLARPVEVPAERSTPPRTYTQPAPAKSRLPLLLGLGAGGIILFGIVIVGIFIVGSFLMAGNTATAKATDTPLVVTSTQAAVVVAPTTTATSTSVPTATATPTSTLPPLFVRINNITVNASNQYVVEYETFGYTETLPGMHVHFFFNTVPPEQAGVPGSGPWILYGGPRPFTKYSVGDRPGAATQMCALVANADHSVIQESGNCFDLP